VTYPPERHVLRDLGVHGQRTPTRSTNRIVARRAYDDGHGHVRLGVVATLLDLTGAGVALAAVAPDWIATADLSCHLTEPIPADGRTGIVVQAGALRAGSSTVVIEADVTDDAGNPCGYGRMSFARLPRSASAGALTPVADDAPVEFVIDGGRDFGDESIVERCAISTGPTSSSSSSSTLDPIPYVRNSFGTVNGGITALLAEHAAATDGVPVGVHVHYLEQVDQGPVDAVVTARRTAPAALHEVHITDRSADRLVAVADVTLR